MQIKSPKKTTVKPKRFGRRIILSIIITLAIVGAIAIYEYEKIASQFGTLTTMEASGALEQISVSTEKVQSVNWPESISAIGETRSLQGTQVTPQVAGIVQKISFQSGQHVKKGDTLVELEHDELSAQLSGAIAERNLAQITYNRDKKLFDKKVVSQSVIDTTSQQLRSANASVDQLQAQLQWRFIKAPFDGRLGLRDVSIGEYLSPGSAITTLNSVSPIYINFTLTQQQLSKVTLGQQIQVTVSSYPKHIFTGDITAIDNQIASETRGLKIQATVLNNDSDKLLLNNMFVKITLITNPNNKLLAIHENAITYSLYGTSIYTIDREDTKYDKPTAKQIYVNILDKKDSLVAISGVKEGQEVITAGTSKITENSQPVVINNETTKNPEAKSENTKN